MNGRNATFLAQVTAATAALLAGLALAGQPAPTTAPASAPASQPAKTAEQRKNDDINRVMEFFRLTQPDVHDQALALRGADPVKFDKLITGALPTVNRLEGVKRKNIKLFDLSIRDLQLGYQSLRIAHELKKTDLPDAERSRLSEQLKGIVALEFDVQQQIRQIEIDDLKQKLRNLDEKVRDRQAEKGNILDKRLKDLGEPSPRLEW